MSQINRRQALVRLAGFTAAVGLTVIAPISVGAEQDPLREPRGSLRAPQFLQDDDVSEQRLPPPDRSGIEHIVLVMMENRSFDHFLGWMPHHDGRQAGLSYADKDGVLHPTHRLAPDYQGCGFHDPDHSFSGGRVEYDTGKCDGWLRAGKNDLYSIGYYIQEDLPFFGKIAPHFATPDNYFAAILGPTFPNRIFQHAGQTDRLSNTPVISTLPTIWDRLAAAGISGRYYFSDLPALALWGSKYLSISRPVATFFADAATGTLPAVSFIDPAFLGEAIGTTNDDHPFNDIRNGQLFLDSLYRAVTTGPAWHNTIFIINYDEWGGFFDHVPPPVGALTPAEQALGYTDGLRGFRVPCLVISPWSQHGKTPHAVFDHTSILKLIEWRFGLQPLSVRDAQANNLALALDFEEPRFKAPAASVPPGPYGSPCLPSPASATPQAATPTADGTESEWLGLLDLARQTGWPV